MKIKETVKKPWILICLSAVLSAIPFTFDFAFLLSWVSFVPLFYSILTNPPQKFKNAIGQGFLFGFVYHICIYYWFIWFYPLDYVDLGPLLSLVVVFLAWFGISALHGVLWCVPFVISSFAAKKVKSPALLSAITVAGIMISQKATTISELAFPWVRISIGQYRATPLIQSASLFGIDGVDMLILAVNVLVALTFIYPVKVKKLTSLAATIIFIANLSFGLIRLNTDTKATDSIKVLAVQGSVDKEDKWAYDGDVHCFNVYSRLTRKNITKDTELVIWPESAVPVEYTSDTELKAYKRLSQKIDTPILAGILKSEEGIQTNNTVLIDEKNVSKPYSKRILVPFGEYMPYQEVLSKAFPFLENLNLLDENYTEGTSSALIKIKDKNVGNIICFESIYPRLVRESTRDGAQLIVEVTNDSWLEDSPAMKQHLAHGVFRSVENSRYLIRSANSGISATIDSRGRIRQELGALKEGIISDTVDFEDAKTLYTTTGDILLPVFIGVVVLWSFAYILKNKKCDE